MAEAREPRDAGGEPDEGSEQGVPGPSPESRDPSAPDAVPPPVEASGDQPSGRGPDGGDSDGGDSDSGDPDGGDPDGGDPDGGDDGDPDAEELDVAYVTIERDPSGDVMISGLSALHADTLVQVPLWLRSDDPKVRERLLPDAYQDAEDDEQWRRYVGPELDHLFASRAELVERDLATLVQDGETTFSLVIRQKHGAAWISALGGARLALFALHGFTATDMERHPAELGNFEKELAMVRIDIMGLMQELLMEAGV